MNEHEREAASRRQTDLNRDEPLSAWRAGAEENADELGVIQPESLEQRELSELPPEETVEPGEYRREDVVTGEDAGNDRAKYGLPGTRMRREDGSESVSGVGPHPDRDEREVAAGRHAREAEKHDHEKKAAKGEGR